MLPRREAQLKFEEFLRRYHGPGTMLQQKYACVGCQLAPARLMACLSPQSRLAGTPCWRTRSMCAWTCRTSTTSTPSWGGASPTTPLSTCQW